MESSSDETDHHHGRSYECVFCKRGFTTAQALGGHMNIHRKDKANNNKSTKPNTYPSSSTKVVVDDDDDNNNNINKSYADHGFYSAINPSHLVVRGNNTPSHDWRQRSLSPLCVGEVKDKVQQDNINEEDGLDLELRLGHYP